jgi:hypothetical protein
MQVQVAERASYATKHKFMRPISPKQALMCAAPAYYYFAVRLPGSACRHITAAKWY